jgi:Tfp pilus assembly protein PilP
MRQEKRVIGFQKNIDKFLFILATGYLIFVTAWFLKTNKVKANLSEHKNLETKPIVQQKLREENKEQTVLNLDGQEQQNPKIEPKSELVSNLIINKEIPPISEVQPREMPVILKPPIPPPPSNTAPISSLPSGQTTKLTSSLPRPIKVAIPPPPQPQSISPVASVPVLNSHNHKTSPNPESPLPSSDPMETINYNHKLVGLIELEDQSNVALFQVKDLTQGVKVGEEIGVSGWILTAINEKQAIVNKKGTVVRLTVGEKF